MANPTKIPSKALEGRRICITHCNIPGIRAGDEARVTSVDGDRVCIALDNGGTSNLFWCQGDRWRVLP